MVYSDEGYFLRALKRNDFELIHLYEKSNRNHLRPWEPLRDEQFFTIESAADRVTRQVESMEAGNSFYFLMLESQGEKVLGRCSYTNIVRGVFQACNLGFSLAESFQGQGLMKRMLKVTNRYCFEQMGLHRIMANHLPSNVRSERVLEALGFEKEGYARDYLKIAGVWEDHVLRSLVSPHGPQAQ
ncbi:MULTISPECIES: GNAT family N-acetyltransferase [Pseudomonas]|uniref:GNAT family N-acetyltransferase n=1 Tax=Pseudomonas lactucae TaxID=2813360 RepID=A0A9X0YAI7_9PSED|nr:MULTISPECIES: GNAT family N-acetyltransferase [Pseudomonas]WQG57383.1 GNAT family N-acetyltransferase [Pseudomonas sp. RTB3]MBN2976390.1 GNAT family N-acetyltransferase [Pseudomonas lactucae]MBN2987395.1 GNAT family N-acetyltransferase [Pseudomonas lactucae]MEB0107900.1 GNAT family N-acetyltransferase [Pseudomonas sp. MH9.3]WPX80783.1 GNAT family N-acetyltransferase [Pseudomonas sp. MH9.3]